MVKVTVNFKPVLGFRTGWTGWK